MFIKTLNRIHIGKKERDSSISENHRFSPLIGMTIK